jgi:Domain of unknown function (DUF6471)
MLHDLVNPYVILGNDGRYHLWLQKRPCPTYNGHMEDNVHIDEDAWERLVKNMLRAEMMRQGVSYEQLVIRLAALGIVDNVLNLRNKVSRGRFTAPFFVQCLVALGIDRMLVPTAASIERTTGEHGAQALARKPKKPAPSEPQ